uniref:Restriction endonuclease n=1 Tax=mine drainage metagenome TaxID=410659 RepID=E6PF37_9ZZZZ
MKFTTKQIEETARKIIRDNSGGIRFNALVAEVLAIASETPRNTIRGSIWNLDAKYSDEIEKPSRGVFAPANIAAVVDRSPKIKLSEESFYEPFADFLKTELGEATEAVRFGGAGLHSKWGTPDVIGIYKPLASDRIKFPGEIISAEIKTDPMQPIVAFGQAIAYRLFSSRTYIAMPATISETDRERLDALCMQFGIGFVLFDLDVEHPNFKILARAQRFSPDMFYVNEFAESLYKHNKEVFNKLFA